MDDLRETEALEQELRRLLRHVPAPEGFADRVIARARQRPAARVAAVGGGTAQQGRRSSFTGIPQRAWWTAAAAAVVLAVGGGDALHLRHQRQVREAAAVQAQMDLAMQVTSHALAEVETGLDRSPAGRYAQLWNGQNR